MQRYGRARACRGSVVFEAIGGKGAFLMKISNYLPSSRGQTCSERRRKAQGGQGRVAEAGPIRPLLKGCLSFLALSAVQRKHPGAGASPVAPFVTPTPPQHRLLASPSGGAPPGFVEHWAQDELASKSVAGPHTFNWTGAWDLTLGDEPRAPQCHLDLAVLLQQFNILSD